jgi:iron complex outermembrane receptor protein
MKKCLFAFAAALGCASSAAAQDNDTIVVLGSVLPLPPGTPAYGSVTIDRGRLAESASGRIENVLADVAGFQQFRRSDSRSANPSAQGATLRALGGNASSRTLVLLDGVPVADPFFGYIPFNALVPERLSLIRVTRGGGVGAFGAGAVAGTIELASATRADLPLVSGSAFYGSRDASELSAAFSPNLGAGFVSVSGRWDRGDGFWTTPASQRVAASVPARYESWSTSLRAAAPLGGDFELQARATLFRDDRTLRFAGADSRSEGEDASIRLIGRGAWKVDALAYVQARDFGNVVISASSFRKSLDQRKTPSTGLGGKIELRPPVGNDHVLRLGTDLRIATGDMHEDGYNANIAPNPRTNLRHAGGRQSTWGVFAEDDWTLGALVLTGSVRADRWKISDGFYHVTVLSGTPPVNPCATPTVCSDRADWQMSGRVGALLHVNDALALRAAAYTGFRLPTLNELYRSFVVFPITTNANPALNPEKLRGAEVGVDLAPSPGIRFGATAFYNRLGDAIANITTGNTLRQRQNVNAIVAKGIELTASARRADFSLSASYAYTDSKVEAPGQLFDRLRPAQTPRHSASATLAWAPAHGPSLSTTLRYVGKQNEDDLQTDALPHALTVDGTASLPLRHGATLVGRVENLFDKTVYTRRVSLPTLSEDVGTPRTFWLGIRLAR